MANQAPDSSGCLMLLLSDGTVLCKTINGRDRIGNMWNKLSPDVNGSYLNGSWSRACSMQDSRLYFSSQTLKNGKVYLAGGEYGTGKSLGEIYDPVSNTWTQLPATGNILSDACSAILEDGKILQASLSVFNKTLIFNPITSTYSNGPNTLGGHNESTWLKLADKSILFVNINSMSSERYIPALNQWTVDANVPSNLYDPYGSETGPGFMLPDGRLFFMGSLGNTAYYTPSGNNSPGTWAAGPNMPTGMGMPDAPGAMMNDGKIIFSCGPKPVSTASIFIAPTYFYEFDYLNNSFTALTAPGGGVTLADTAFNTTMLNLPDGNIMLSKWGLKNYYVHKPNGLPLAAGKPTINSVAQAGCSNTFALTGLLFNGICEGSSYGDDWQMNTNFPIVKLSSGSNVYYARTYNWNSTGLRRGLLPDTTLFTLPPNLPNGTYSLSVSANGNSSNPITFTFSPFPALTSPLLNADICSGTTFLYNAVVNMSNTTLVWTRNAVSGLSNAAISSPQTGNPNEVLINTGSIPKTAVYVYTLTNNSCITNFSVSVVVNIGSPLTVTGNTRICVYESTSLTASGANSYTWSNGALTNTSVISQLASSGYTVSGLNAYACVSSKQVTVTTKTSPTLSISGPSVICEGENGMLTANSDATNFLWSNASGGGSIAVSPTNTSSYSVTATNSLLCKSSASIQVQVQACLALTELESHLFDPEIYPNPFNDKLNISCVLKNDQVIYIKVFDTFGRLLKAEELVFVAGKNYRYLDLSALPAGVYLVMIGNNKELIKTKLIKEN